MAAPPPPVDPVRAACVRLGGVARTAELAAAGITRHRLATAVADGAVLRLREGVYVDPMLPAEVRAAVAHGGALTCAPRLRRLGLWLLETPADVHVAVPPRGRVFDHDGCSCVTHRTDAPAHGGLVGALDAFAHLLRCRGPEHFVVALESALRLGVLGGRDRTELRARIQKRHHHLVDEARIDADSGLESLLRFRLARLGIRLSSQVRVPGVGVVDFVLGDRLILEVDGRDNHEGRSERHRDLVRDAVAASHGFDTLRFDYAMVVHEWELVEAAILAKVERGLHLEQRVVG